MPLHNWKLPWCEEVAYQVRSGMADTREYLVSSSGQISLPAAARHRWNLDGGGPVDVLDLGFAVMMLPKGHAEKLLDDLLPRDAHTRFVASLDADPDLATT